MSIGRFAGPAPAPGGTRTWLVSCFQVVVVLEVVLRLAFLAHWRLDFDETQALHAAYSVARGLVPYRDFWENHTPLFYYVFAPLFWAGASGEVAIFVARGIVALLGIGVLALTYRLARRFVSEVESWAALALLGACGLFAFKIVEARPDILYLILFLAGVEVAVRRRDDGDAAGAVAAGLWLGLAFCATPKALFAAGALGLGLLARGGAIGRWRYGWAQAVRLGLAFLVPPLVLIGGFTLAGAFRPVIRWIFVFNFTVPSASGFSPWSLLARWDVMPFLLLGVAGVGDLVVGVYRRTLDARWSILAVTATILVVSFCFLMPMPYAHSALPFCPLLAIAGARLALRLAQRLRMAILAAAIIVPMVAMIGDGQILFRPSFDMAIELAAGQRIRELIGPDEPYFSSQADAVTRPHLGFFPVLVREVLDGIHRGDYPPADLPGMIDLLRTTQCRLIVMNDFMDEGFTEAQKAWIADHYINAGESASEPWNAAGRYEPRRYLIPGKVIDARHVRPHERVTFEVVVPGTYLLSTGGISEVNLDGAVLDGKKTLAVGRHILFYTGAPRRIVLEYHPGGLRIDPNPSVAH